MAWPSFVATVGARLRLTVGHPIRMFDRARPIIQGRWKNVFFDTLLAPPHMRQVESETLRLKSCASQVRQ